MTRKRILVVDDEPNLRFLLEALLETVGQVVLANNGREAWEKLTRKTGVFDLVVSDFRMPEMNGLELFRLIRSSDKQVKFILMSANMPDERELPEGIFTIAKPFHNKELVELVQKTLDE